MEGFISKIKNSLLLFCFLILILGAVVFLSFRLAWAQPAQRVAINEIMYNPKGDDTDTEWLEIKNLTDAPFDLGGCRFNDGSGHLLYAPPKNGGQGSLVIPPNGFTILANNAAVFRSLYPGVTVAVIDSSFSLKNSPNKISLLGSLGEELSIVYYDPTSGGNGDGFSLERQEANGQIVWHKSQDLGGTPGRENFGATTIPPFSPEQTTSPTSEILPPPTSAGSFLRAEAGPDLAATTNQEISFDAKDSQGDLKYFFWNFGDGSTSAGKTKVTHTYKFPGTYLVSLTVGDGRTEITDTCQVTVFNNSFRLSEFLPWTEKDDKNNEWIEIYNQSEDAQFLDGWQLSDSGTKSKPFVFPKKTLIAPKSYLVVSHSVTNIALNNNGDTLKLLFPNGSLVQEIKYAKAKKGFSAAMDEDNNFFWTALKTPGGPNFSQVPAEDTANQKPVSLLTPRKLALEVFVKKQAFSNLIPPVQAAQVQEQKTDEASLLQAEEPTKGSFLNDKKAGDNQTGSVAPTTQKNGVLKTPPEKNNLPLIILFVSLVSSLTIFGVWLGKITKNKI